MTNQEHFNRSVAVLVKAHLHGVLQKNNCAACAVGNLVAGACGYALDKSTWPKWLDKNGDPVREEWDAVAWNLSGKRYWPAVAIAQVEATGYTPKQFSAIEDAFMSNLGVRRSDAEWENFDRLMNTVDKLADIHGIDLATAEASKLLFVRA